MSLPEWTDENRHDPGITLLELLAFVAAGLLFGLWLSHRWPFSKLTLT
jgi:hypothetical protein